MGLRKQDLETAFGNLKPTLKTEPQTDLGGTGGWWESLLQRERNVGTNIYMQILRCKCHEILFSFCYLILHMEIIMLIT